MTPSLISTKTALARDLPTEISIKKQANAKFHLKLSQIYERVNATSIITLLITCLNRKLKQGKESPNGLKVVGLCPIMCSQSKYYQ